MRKLLLLLLCNFVLGQTSWNNSILNIYGEEYTVVSSSVNDFNNHFNPPQNDYIGNLHVIMDPIVLLGDDATHHIPHLENFDNYIFSVNSMDTNLQVNRQMFVSRNNEEEITINDLPYGRYSYTFRTPPWNGTGDNYPDAKFTGEFTITQQDLFIKIDNRLVLNPNQILIKIISNDISVAKIKYKRTRNGCTNCYNDLATLYSKPGYKYIYSWSGNQGFLRVAAGRDIDYYLTELYVEGANASAPVGVRVVPNRSYYNIGGASSGGVRRAIGNETGVIEFTYDYTWYHTYPALLDSGWTYDRIIRVTD